MATQSKTDLTQISEQSLLFKKHSEQLLHYVKKNYRSKILSVHILLGSKNTGKSALLAHSELDFKCIIPPLSSHEKCLIDKQNNDLDEQHCLENNPNVYKDDYCRFWASDNNVFIDIPDEYFLEDKHTQQNTMLLMLLNFLIKQKRFLHLHSIIVAVDSIEVAYKDGLAIDIKTQRLKNRMLAIHKRIQRPINLYLIITKLDKLAGFSAYFSNLHAAEREKIVGMTFPDPEEAGDGGVRKSISDGFKQQYQKLMERYNAHMLKHLHQEHNQLKRAQMNEFPLQLTLILPGLMHTVSELVEKTAYFGATLPVGVYFTSSMQDDMPIDRVSESLSRVFEIENAGTNINFGPTKSYFIKELFQRIITMSESDQTVIPRDWSFKGIMNICKREIKAISISIAMTTALTIFFIQQYHDDVQQLNATKNNLAKLKANLSRLINTSKQNTTLAQVIPILNGLELLNKDIQDSQTFLELGRYLPWHNRLDLKTQTTYETAIQKLFIPLLKTAAMNKLASKGTPAAERYSALKIYLMLRQPVYLQPRYVIHWLYSQHNQAISEQLNDPKVRTHLNHVLSDYKKLNNSKNKSITISDPVVLATRDQLNTLPNAFLAYLIIKDGGIADSKLSLNFNNFIHNPAISLFNKHVDNNGIPYYFTIDGFKHIFLKQITSLQKIIITETWALGGNDLQYPANRPESTKLKEQIIKLYFSDYANWWKIYISRLDFANFTSLNEEDDFIKALTSHSNPLYEVIHAIAENTQPQSFITIAAEHYQQLGPLKKTIFTSVKRQFSDNAIFKNIHQLINAQSGQSSGPLEQISFGLTRLHNYLNTITSAHDPQKAAFETAVLRMQNHDIRDPISNLFKLASQAPAPLNDHLQNIANKTWQFILEQAKNYINMQWQQQVVTEYNNNLAHRYPLFTKSNEDISLTNFQRFFGNKGTLDEFFTNYIKPFVDTQNATWQWKAMDKQYISLQPSTLLLFERAHIIQQMFFPNKANNLTVNFTLQPLMMSHTIQSVTIDMNGQLLMDSQGSHYSKTFSWPGNHPNVNQTDLTMLTSNDQQIKTTITGPWAVFRLFSEANIQSSNNRNDNNENNFQFYQLTFSNTHTNDQATYALHATQPINPFIPGIINRFRIPTTL